MHCASGEPEPIDELFLPSPSARVSAIHEQRRRTEHSTSRLARVQWHLRVFPRTRDRYYPDWSSDRSSPRAATGCNCREFPTHFYGVHHAFISCHYAGGMGACSGGYDTRLSVLVRCREAHRKGLHHARGSGYDDGRLCWTISAPHFKVRVSLTATLRPGFPQPQIATLHRFHITTTRCHSSRRAILHFKRDREAVDGTLPGSLSRQRKNPATFPSRTGLLGLRLRVHR